MSVGVVKLPVAPVPPPPADEQLVALVDVQLMFEVAPYAMEEGFALTETVGLGTGVGVGVGVGGVGLGVGKGVGLGVGAGVGVAVGIGDGAGEGVGLPIGVRGKKLLARISKIGVAEGLPETFPALSYA